VVLGIEGFGDLVTSSAAPLATGWSESCRAGITPAEERHLVTAHSDSIFFLRVGGEQEGTATVSAGENRKMRPPRQKPRWRGVVVFRLHSLTASQLALTPGTSTPACARLGRVWRSGVRKRWFFAPRSSSGLGCEPPGWRCIVAFPPPALPGCHSTTSLSASPRRPGLSRAGVRWAGVPPPPLGLPVLRPSHEKFRGLLSVHSRYGLPARGTAWRSLASKASALSLPPAPLRLLPAGAKVAGRELHPLKKGALPRSTATPFFAPARLSPFCIFLSNSSLCSTTFLRA